MTLTSGIVRPREQPAQPVPAGYRPDGERIMAVLPLARLPRTTLAEVNAVAELQTRMDRKYLVPGEVAQQLIDQLDGGHHLMSVAGRAVSSYATVYFDTPNWDAFRAHAQGRRRRWKIRSRLYLEDRFCRLELKTKNGRGATVKHALEQPAATFGTITAEGRGFLTGCLVETETEAALHQLRPGVRIDYARATLCDLADGTRFTVDAGLVASLGNRVVRIRPDHVLIETKGGMRPAPVDSLLRSLGARETEVSKYSVALSMLEDALPGHRWHSTASRYFVRSAA